MVCALFQSELFLDAFQRAFFEIGVVHRQASEKNFNRLGLLAQQADSSVHPFQKGRWRQDWHALPWVQDE
jgi:hypothetical protein